jgi:hypothetical protein
MNELGASLYWAITGALISFGGLALMSIDLPFLIAGCGLAIVCLFTLELRGVWAITLGVGGAPMAVLLIDGIDALASPDPSCTQEGSVSLPAGAGTGASVSCTLPLSGGYVAVILFFAAIAVSGVLWRLFVLRRF